MHEVSIQEPELLGRGSTVQFQDPLLPFRVDGGELFYEPIEIGLVAQPKAVDGGGLFPAFWGEGAPDPGGD